MYSEGRKAVLPLFFAFLRLVREGAFETPPVAGAEWQGEIFHISALSFCFSCCHSVESCKFRPNPVMAKALAAHGAICHGHNPHVCVALWTAWRCKAGRKRFEPKNKQHPPEISSGCRSWAYARICAQGAADVRTVTTKRPVMPGQRAFLIPLLWRGPVFVFLADDVQDVE